MTVVREGVEHGGVDVLDGQAVFVAVLQGPFADSAEQTDGRST